MAHVDHHLCAILDLSGSRYNGVFLVREMAIVGMNETLDTAVSEIFDFHPFMLAFKENAPVATTPAAKKRKLSDLETQSPSATSENAVHDLNKLNERLMFYYNKVKTEDNKVVGFKGGDCEKELLQKLNIPFLNLEAIGCPKYDNLTDKFKNLSCTYHRLRGIHCPVSEVSAFKCWYKKTFIKE